MRAKLLHSGMMPEIPASSGKVYEGEERLQYLKNMPENSDFRSTTEREIGEAKQTEITDDQISKMVSYVNEAGNRVPAAELATHFGLNPMKVKWVMDGQARKGKVKKLGRGAYFSMTGWKSLSPDERFQLNQT